MDNSRTARSGIILGVFASWVMLVTGASAQTNCPKPAMMGGDVKTYTFDDGSVAVRSALAVNPDGGAASYMVGDGGFAYIANGVDLRLNGKNLNCKNAANDCRKKFLDRREITLSPRPSDQVPTAYERQVC